VRSGRSVTPAPSATPTSSRRALRSQEAARPSRRRTLVRGLRAWFPRSAVLVALATATIGVPLVQAAAPGDASAVDVAAAQLPSSYPTAYDILSAAWQDPTPTSVLAAAPPDARVAQTVSRSFDRDPLPGCDGQARGASRNGQVPAKDLCTLWDGKQMLRGDAAVALSELNRNFHAAFGRNMCITDSYRSLAEQRRVAYQKPGLAATPGTSNHGWGLAIDFCTSENRSSAVMKWLGENGPIYGWDNPDWARRGGAGAYEPWHWEYVPGTTELGTNY
jgi:D-alanyl-D-alanine carboxypeptidase